MVHPAKIRVHFQNTSTSEAWVLLELSALFPTLWEHSLHCLNCEKRVKNLKVNNSKHPGRCEKYAREMLHKLGVLCVCVCEGELRRQVRVGVCCTMEGEIKPSEWSGKW